MKRQYHHSSDKRPHKKDTPPLTVLCLDDHTASRMLRDKLREKCIKTLRAVSPDNPLVTFEVKKGQIYPISKPSFNYCDQTWIRNSSTDGYEICNLETANSQQLNFKLHTIEYIGGRPQCTNNSSLIGSETVPNTRMGSSGPRHLSFPHHISMISKATVNESEQFVLLCSTKFDTQSFSVEKTSSFRDVCLSISSSTSISASHFKGQLDYSGGIRCYDLLGYYIIFSGNSKLFVIRKNTLLLEYVAVGELKLIILPDKVIVFEAKKPFSSMRGWIFERYGFFYPFVLSGVSDREGYETITTCVAPDGWGVYLSNEINVSILFIIDSK